MSPFLAGRTAELKSWDDIKLLSVSVDRLRKWWRPGFICIGDAAHAMSPIGGVGINIAVQDAVAAANRLAGPLKAAARSSDEDLARDQGRRTLPVRFTQWLQLNIQKPVISRVLDESRRRPKPPLFFKLTGMFPVLRRIPARLIGVGIRPEHVHTPDAGALITSRRRSAPPPQFRIGAGEDFHQARFGLGVAFKPFADGLAQMIEGGFDERRQAASLFAFAARSRAASG